MEYEYIYIDYGRQIKDRLQAWMHIACVGYIMLYKAYFGSRVIVWLNFSITVLSIYGDSDHIGRCNDIRRYGLPKVIVQGLQTLGSAGLDCAHQVNQCLCDQKDHTFLAQNCLSFCWW